MHGMCELWMMVAEAVVLWCICDILPKSPTMSSTSIFLFEIMNISSVWWWRVSKKSNKNEEHTKLTKTKKAESRGRREQRMMRGYRPSAWKNIWQVKRIIIVFLMTRSTSSKRNKHEKRNTSKQTGVARRRWE